VLIGVPDGGGVRVLSSLLILKQCMQILQEQLGLDKMPEVYEYFDVIGGTGTGG
jgi:patatin-like phospholipase/acyl hydrolase